MDLEGFRGLLTAAGQEALQAAQAMQPQEANYLRDYSALCSRYPSDLARAALEIAILRGEAAVKFPFANQMYFTRAALEQASSYEVSAYRMQRYRPFERQQAFEIVGGEGRRQARQQGWRGGCQALVKMLRAARRL